jgi:hypothetical protein
LSSIFHSSCQLLFIFMKEFASGSDCHEITWCFESV